MTKRKFTRYDWCMLFVFLNMCLTLYYAIIDDMPHAIYHLIWMNMWMHDTEREEDKNGIG